MPAEQKKNKSHRSAEGTIDPETRREMIEEAAYYRSQSGESSGDPVEDWLAAEQEIDRILAERQQGGKEEELAAFNRLRKELSKILSEVKDSIHSDTLNQALDKAKREVSRLGEFTAESINKGAEALKKDVARNIVKLGGKWQSMSVKAIDLFSIWSRRSAVFLKQASEAADTWRQEIQEKVHPHSFHSGELVSGGTFVCKSCGQKVKLDTAGHLPRCPHCDHTEFTL